MSAVSRGKAFENFVADQLKQMGYHIAYKCASRPPSPDAYGIGAFL